MNPRDDRQAGVDPADARLIDQIRRGYVPPALTEVERTRFDAQLRARIARQQRRRWGLAGLALAGAAAAVTLFALQPPSMSGPGDPSALPPMAETHAVDPLVAPVDDAEPAVALEWLLDDSPADWLGGSTVLPSDPLALSTLGATAAADTVADAEAEDETADTADEDDGGPAWMPEEYTVLAGLIEIDPYDPYAEDWP